jgi:uncharacterized protein (DUF427 family)
MADHAGRVRVEDSPKRVRTYLGGVCVADTTHAKLVWEIPYFPTYYIPEADVRTELLKPSEHTSHSPSRGTAEHYTVVANGVTATDAAWIYPDSPLEPIRGHFRFEWGAMGAWLEEDDEVIVHPRDPYTRVDTLRSSRHVEVVVDGVKVADSVRPTLLFETNLPTRYYLPQSDVRMELLTPTDTSSQCPYKGTARYWTVRVDGTEHVDLAWSYQSPLRESERVAGLVCFYNEKVDLVVDGDMLERPRTHFS